jgi:nucleoside-triphosphatase
MGNAFLLTGEPKVGKSTALATIVKALGPGRCGGFYTEEIREGDVRVGFRIVTISGFSGVIAHVSYTTANKQVGRYGVNLATLETIGVPAIYEAINSKEFVIIDEIGPMQLFSQKFKEAVLYTLSSAKPLVGTIVLRSENWANTLKERNEVQLYQLTSTNRDAMTKMLTCYLQGLCK